ncbi:hypothetical protein ELI38_06325 [Rhizobium leguminosarum]|uniref:hypothetical protein n=1 Tax=Rhizobium leguminosarum TaxID=384 RepID=UPI00102FEC20|nr:hypothetical protein [Rhizobium leguminosarum]NKK44473.1 hypothetical protein [Rhizobium leguminosarum bv. viciae]QIO72086.1 hypothetical protein HA459_08655 [Rhizobium leguminosarum bv. trifolii]QIO79104.1 hypothetical protein HA460_08685 [Rhizobium leguminosarum bv. trifolii]TAU20117.1 hypothetical protein ELI50_05840 [Rhizobium leguminosarum]TAU40122.1 hypothetical protein ELI51_06580 [Rhizobium leguminosarum]
MLKNIGKIECLWETCGKIAPISCRFAPKLRIPQRIRAILDMSAAFAHTKAGSRHRPLADENPW